jgi:S1-C subfamily serine protease
MPLPRALLTLSVLVAAILAAGCVKSADVRPFDASTPVAATGTSRTILFAKVANRVPAGHHVGTLALGYLCENNAKIHWTQATFSETAAMVASAFETEAEKAGYRVVRQESDSLFDGATAARAEVLVAAVVKSFAFNICRAGFASAVKSSGESSLEIEWQVFDARSRRVVATVTTGGSAKTPRQTNGGTKSIYEAAAAAARNVLAREQFVAVLAGEPRSAAAEPPLDPLVLDVLGAGESLGTFPDVIEGVQRSVVTIRTESGLGSGFIVSPTGYVVTSAHVVDRSTHVKVTLASGRELDGTVVRRHASTDVALVQLEDGMYPAAPLGSSTWLKAGASVFAIGSPLGRQGTVTRGIVSAVRVEEGRRLIQSDATVHAGSSGGPLLDERGRVVAITRSGRGLFGTFGVGLNEFVPIEEAWVGLRVEPHPVDSSPSASPQP